jgi:hypothetical protein
MCVYYCDYSYGSELQIWQEASVRRLTLSLLSLHICCADHKSTSSWFMVCSKLLSLNVNISVAGWRLWWLILCLKTLVLCMERFSTCIIPVRCVWCSSSAHAQAHTHANFILPTTKQLPNAAANTDYDTLTMMTDTTTPICNSCQLWPRALLQHLCRPLSWKTHEPICLGGM